MKKGLFIVCLAMVFCMILSACGGSQSSGGTTTAANSAVAATTTTAVATTTAAMAATTAAGAESVTAAANQPIEMRFLALQGIYIEDFYTNKFTLWMEEQTGFHVNWETIPRQGWEEKFALVLAGGDYPDVFYGVYLSADKEVQYGSVEKILVPLNDYLKDCPNITAGFDSDPSYWGAVTNYDGSIYAIPYISDCAHCNASWKMWINQYFLDQLGLDTPKTTDDFYEVLKAFRDNDPNGNGKNDEIPMAAALDNWQGQMDTFLLNAFIPTRFGYRNPMSGIMLDGEKMVASFMQDDFKEGVRYVAKLYQEGLIMADSMSMNLDQLIPLVENESDALVGAVPGGGPILFCTIGGERYRQWQAIAPLIGPNGMQAAATNITMPGSGIFAITKNCKYPELAIKFADVSYSYEGTMRLRRGVPGVDWKEAEPGDIGIDGNPATWIEITPWQETDPQNQSFVEEFAYFEPASMRLGQKIDADLDIWSAEGNSPYLERATADFYEMYRKPETVVPTLRLLPEEVSDFTTVITELESYIKITVAQFYTGELDIDKDWDAYIARLEELGIQRLLDRNEKAYARQYLK